MSNAILLKQIELLKVLVDGCKKHPAYRAIGLQLATVNRVSKCGSAAGVKRYEQTMLVDTLICNFGLKAPDFELISHDGKSYSRDSLTEATDC